MKIIFTKSHIPISLFLITFFAFILIPNASAQITDDEFAMIELFPRETRDAEDSIRAESIDVERDLGLSEIESLLILLVVLFGLVVLMSVLSAMKKISTFILIVGLIGVLLSASLIGFEIFIRTSLLGEMYGRTDSLWEDIQLNDFARTELNDIPHSYSREIDQTRLRSIFSIPDIYMNAIDNAINDVWQDNQNTRESIMLEFNTRDDANNFVNQVFNSENNFRLRRGSYSQGTFKSEDDVYRRGFLMSDNRFVFLSFSQEAFSDNLFNYIMESYPEQYIVNDNRPPTIEIIGKKVTNIDEIIFRVSDRESGINKLSISLLGLDFNPINDCKRNINVRFDEFICSARNLQRGTNNFVIVASDRERNNAKKNIEYTLDTDKPTIDLISQTRDKIIVRVQDDFSIYREGISVIAGSSKLSGTRYCSRSSLGFTCEFPIQGETMKIIATDKAGNKAEKEIEFDFTIPVINFINPQSKYTNDRRIEFFVIDEASGLKKIDVEINQERINICSTVDSRRQRCRHELANDRNIIKVTAEDNSGNILEYEKEFLLDKNPPSITIISTSNSVLEFYVRDDDSGINTEWIFVNDGTFLVDDICTKESVGFRCRYNIRNQDNEARIRVSDNAGNIKEIREPLNS